MFTRQNAEDTRAHDRLDYLLGLLEHARIEQAALQRPLTDDLSPYRLLLARIERPEALPRSA